MWRRVYAPEPQWKLPEYAWGQERELCKRCEHYRERIGGARTAERNTVMVCALNTRHKGTADYGVCIDMRYGGECGREGKLFQPSGE
jgi:hypothetical protein